MLAIFLDIETTGLDPKLHAPIDIAFQIIDINNSKRVCKYQSLINPSLETWQKADPSSMQVHGYSWDQLSSGKDPSVVGTEIINAFQEVGVTRGKAVFICQNPAFDRGFFTQLIDVYTQESLNWPYHWLDFASMYWALLVHKTTSQNLDFPVELCLSKNAIAQEFGLLPESTPHHAENGVEHLIQCYQAVVGLETVLNQ